MQTISPEEAIKTLPNPVVLLGCKSNGKHNVMTAGWIAPATKDPAQIMVAINNDHITKDMIEASKEFVVSVLSEQQQQAVSICGRNDGDQTDKIQLAHLTTAPATKIETPIIEGCAANLECRLADAFTAGTHTIFLGEVIAGHKENTQPVVWYDNRIVPLLN